MKKIFKEEKLLKNQGSKKRNLEIENLGTKDYKVKDNTKFYLEDLNQDFIGIMISDGELEFHTRYEGNKYMKGKFEQNSLSFTLNNLLDKEMIYMNNNNNYFNFNLKKLMFNEIYIDDQSINIKYEYMNIYKTSCQNYEMETSINKDRYIDSIFYTDIIFYIKIKDFKNLIKKGKKNMKELNKIKIKKIN